MFYPPGIHDIKDFFFFLGGGRERKHTQTETHTHTDKHTRTHTHTCTCTHTHTHAPMHAHTRTHAHTHTHARERTHTHTYTCTYAHTHTHTRARAHTHTHTHTHTYTHTQTAFVIHRPQYAVTYKVACMLTSGAVGRGNNQNYKVFLLQVIVAVLFVCFSFKTYAACKVSGRLLWLIHCGGLSWVYRNLELSTTDDELGGGGSY